MRMMPRCHGIRRRRCADVADASEKPQGVPNELAMSGRCNQAVDATIRRPDVTAVDESIRSNSNVDTNARATSEFLHVGGVPTIPARTFQSRSSRTVRMCGDRRYVEMAGCAMQPRNFVCFGHSET
ncbi:hypothetical protein H310_06657 [Aphanomyces invadans]|uniref:Uncharacterized protein n=1 Tax=Aphanomyces invadans TaxID=157072 RepID=A0A024U5Z6_9STRA|nr:hypothetical protein H310_06657 [Aphanomyces invadans]ETW01023.1 hypothetical protein H310_06657 [Aphanomyces invadans]|eukprot:XP_008870021.1 hypothetical protein H310_06657 [Aphanomyces invadans]